MQNFFIAIIIFLSVLVQTSLLPNFFPAGSVPDLALILIMIWTAKSDFNSILKWAIIAGIFMDLISFWPVGINIFSFVAVAFAVNSLSKRFLVVQSTWRFFILAIMIIFGTLMNLAIIFFLMKISARISGLSDAGLSIFNQNLFLKPLYNLLIFVIIFWPLEKLDKILRHQNKRVIIKR